MALIPVISDAEAYEQLATALYGDGAWELVSKAKSDQAKRERTQARVGLASNVLGIAAGTAGLAAASKLPALRKTGASLDNAGPVTRRLAPKISPKRQARLIQAGAGGAVGLQAANLGGDFVSNRVLARQAKKPVSKSVEGAGKLVRTAKDDGSMSFTAQGTISKSVEDKRQVFGWASIVELNGEPVVDLQGDYMTIDVIEKAAYDYVHKSRKGSDMHAGHHASDLIESFIVTEEKKKLLNLPDSTPTGWWVGFKVNDDDLWQMVKDGKRPEFSIHGSGQRVDVEI